MEKCYICPRNCGAKRMITEGTCKTGEGIKVSKIMVHHWEEPPVSGSKGSGCIFFTGCSLGCVYCQNREISGGKGGRIYSEEELTEAIYSLKDKVHNINFVTGTHMTEYLIPVLKKLKKNSFPLPLIWNTSSYEKVDTLKKLDGLIDVYLADFKYMDKKIAKRYSNAPDYPKTAASAFNEMYRQTGQYILEDGLIKKGIIARHLVLPGMAEDSMDVIDHLYTEFKNNIIYSIMMQYTPLDIEDKFSEINRKVTPEEYDRILNFTLALGVQNAFIQEIESSSESFIPDFKS